MILKSKGFGFDICLISEIFFSVIVMRCLMSLPPLASMYSDMQSERPDIGSIMTHPDYLDGNPDLIKPKKLLNPVRASKSHQELHRELLMNHRR